MSKERETQVEFDRCIDFLVRMVQQYGAEVLQEVEEIEHNHGDGYVA